jgi:branched-chain amino acid transport system ATP-binding protein
MPSSPIRRRARFTLAPDALTLEDVHSFYGESHVLQGVSLSLKQGQLLALLGRNGAGKTTCIATIVGFLPPKRGDIRLFGQSIARLRPETICRRGIALVPQGRRVFPSLTVRENLDVARRAASDRSSPWTFDRVYNLFPRLRERQKQLAGSLSGGEQQMLAIGRALMGNPKVLLLDEPSEGLAPLIVAEVGLALALLRSEGQSILLVEQNSKLALQLADDVVILTTGCCVFRGAAADVRDNEALLAQNLGVVINPARQ